MKLRFALSLILGVLAMSGTLSAALVDCPAPPPPSQTVDTTAPGPGAYTLTCGGLTFSQFEVIDAGTTLPGIMNLISAAFDTSARTVFLNFNPNMFAAPLTTEDMHFYFKVSGPLTGIDLGVGGSHSVITERACATVIDRNAGNVCAGGVSNELAVLTNFSGNTPLESTFQQVSAAYIFKDILADGRRAQGGAELTTFTQSFHSSAVPEPMSLLLMSGGLIALATLRKWRVQS